MAMTILPCVPLERTALLNENTFKAACNDASSKSVKGLFGASCARHDLTLKMVGMDSGEGFPKCHVFLQCSPLNGMTDTDLMALLTKCSNEKPIHVMKHTVEQTLLFSADMDMLISPAKPMPRPFFFLYNNNNHMLYRKLKDVLIQPGRDGGVDVSYDSSQSRLDEHVHSWCTCLSPSPSSNSDENAPVARHRVTAAEDTTVLKRLIDDLKDEIKEDEEMMKRKKRKLAFLQVAYEC